MRSASFLVVTLLTYTNIASALTLSTRSVEHFEKRYIDTLDYQQHNETIKLIGYKTVKIPLHRQAEFEELYNTHAYNEEYTGFRSAYYDFESAGLRVYFPVAGALVEHDGKLIEANELGEFDLEDIQGDYHVQGRYQTDKVHGHEGNIVKDGIVYLGQPCPPSHRHGRIHVYDFGLKSLDDHTHPHHAPKLSRRQSEETNGEGSEDQQPNRGCIKNHGGINCSKAYGIDNGRCPFRADTCMDYNGYLSNTLGDCKKEDKYLYFVGSDCFSSVAKGNCWNEMVSAEDE